MYSSLSLRTILRAVLLPLLTISLLLLAACSGTDTAEQTNLVDLLIEEDEVESTDDVQPKEDGQGDAIIEEDRSEPESDEVEVPSVPTATADEFGRIAFITGGGRLGTVNASGENLRFLTSSGLYQFPAWSPTDNTLAVIGTKSTGSGVFVTKDQVNNEIVTLYSDERRGPIYLYWTPDGNQVSFIAPNRGSLALHLAPSDGETESEIISRGQPFYWQWLADSDRILVHTGGSRLSFLDLEGNEDETGVAAEGFFQAPALSNNGRFLAFSDARGEVDEENPTRSLLIKDLESSEEVFEQQHNGLVAMTWSPTANQLAYMSPIENELTFFGPLQLLDADTGERSVLVSENVIAYFWSPDGSKIAYISFRDPSRQAKSVLSKPTSQQQRPLLNLGIIDVATGAQRSLLRFQPTRLFVTQFIPFFDQYALSHRIWSPDSQQIVLPMVHEERGPEITVIPIDGGPPTAVANGIIAFWSQK